MDKSILELRIEIEPYLKYCRTQEIVPGKLVECFVENPTCYYLFNYGNSKYCNHPLKF